MRGNVSIHRYITSSLGAILVTPTEDMLYKYMKLSFVADRVRIAGPRIDGNYTVTFEVGEYGYDFIKDVPKLNGESIFVEVKDGGKETGSKN